MTMSRRLTKKEREERVLDLYYNQKMNYRDIAKLERICPRDIGAIVNKESKDADSKRSLSKAAQAYDLFSQGKSPMEVAIALDLREPEVTQLYKESWNLRQIWELNRIYLETNFNLAPFLNLYKLAKAEGMEVEHVMWLLRVANKGLPELENTYYNYKSEVDSLETRKQISIKIIQEYSRQINALGEEFYKSCIRCEQEGKKLSDLQIKRLKEEALVRQFENKAEYIKIGKTIEEKAYTILSDRKKLLELCALSIIESIKEDPEKYNSLSRFNMSSAIEYTMPDFDSCFMYVQQPSPPLKQQSKVYFTEDYVAILSEDASKLMEKLVKELENQMIDEYFGAASFP